ncbi:hypothetical protein F0U60_11965 [Archangium minus]|uniref:Uncharacterized protein n=1 Tax=Archangium minus TaxID=83450 RepID=A0ABY9WN90_9BACT|nr:hypothetical protein F0U60_11965 [Archangium minus]
MRGRGLALQAGATRVSTPRGLGGPRAGASLASAGARLRCSRIARIPPPAITYASTRRLPPHLTQTNTSKSNVLLSNSAQSTRGVPSFIRSLLAATSCLALASSSPA